MLVADRMSKKVVTVPEDCSLADARDLLQRHRIRQVPVVRAGRVIGIITDRDLRREGSRAKTVGDAMTREPLIVSPREAVDEAARVLRMRKVNALPVVDGARLVGILTASDILDAFIDLSGVGESTYRLSMTATGLKNSGQLIRQIVEAHRGELKWLHQEKRGKQEQNHLRLKARYLDDICDALEGAGFEVTARVATKGRAGASR